MIKINDRIDFLRQRAFFRLFESPALSVLAFSAEEKAFKKDELLFQKGDAAFGGHIISAGRVTTRGLKKDIQLEAGALLMEEALLIALPYSFSAIATCDVSTIFIERETMTRFLKAHP